MLCILENALLKGYFNLYYTAPSTIRVSYFSNFLYRNPDNIHTFSKKHNPVLNPTDGRGDAQYEVVTIDTATSHVSPSIPPPPQPTDGDVVYEQVH